MAPVPAARERVGPPVRLVVEADVQQIPLEAAAEVHAGPVAHEQFRHVVRFAERTREVCVEDLPLVLLRVGRPHAPAPVVGCPQPHLEAQLELRLRRVELSILPGSLEEWLVRRRIEVAGPAREEQVVLMVEIDGVPVGVGIESPCGIDQRWRRTQSTRGLPGSIAQNRRRHGRRQSRRRSGHRRVRDRSSARTVVARKALAVGSDRGAVGERRRRLRERDRGGAPGCCKDAGSAEDAAGIVQFVDLRLSSERKGWKLRAAGTPGGACERDTCKRGSVARPLVSLTTIAARGSMSRAWGRIGRPSQRKLSSAQFRKDHASAGAAPRDPSRGRAAAVRSHERRCVDRSATADPCANRASPSRSRRGPRCCVVLRSNDSMDAARGTASRRDYRHASRGVNAAPDPLRPSRARRPPSPAPAARLRWLVRARIAMIRGTGTAASMPAAKPLF